MTTACPDTHALVVVDANALAPDRDPEASCLELDDRADGLAALEQAGHDTAPTARDGDAFVCRIDDLPSAAQRIATDARPNYREDCADTPPPTAYWSFWVAEPGSCTWTYATTGASSAGLRPGGAHGWSFAIDATAGSPPEPGFDPCSSSAQPRMVTASNASDSSASPSDASASGGVDPIAGVALLAGLLVVALLVRRRRRSHGGAPGGRRD